MIEGKRKPTYTDWMKHRVDSDKGKWVYSHRLSTVELVFGNIGTNKGLNRFSLRGKDKVQGQYPKRYAGQALAAILYDSQHRKAKELRKIGLIANNSSPNNQE